MLSKDALSQLSSLKDNIASEKEIVEATVRGTAKRFGFARLDDGRDAFLEPDEMVRVLPGDRVRISLSENSKGQLEGTLEELIESPLDRFVGRYVKKGQAHFVEPDLKPFGRWLFIPPQERTNCAEGDLVECQMIRHPFRYEGRAQVRVVNRIGRPEEIGIEGRYIAAKFDLPEQWPEPALEQTRALKDNPPPLADERDDLTELPLVTIDSEFTRDMDDAIHARRLDDGWMLTTAIADPGAYIEPGSPLELTARERATTLYLLGHPISMLPTELSHDILSLVPGEDRPALVCELQIASDGEVRDYHFRQAMIRSHHKLSYQGVTQLIETGEADTDLPEAVIDSLKALHQVSEARLAYRQRHALVMEDRADYQYWLNDQKKIERIEKRTRNIAQKMVEEAMLVTNICAGDLFSQHPQTGLFSTHVGFRPERLDDARQMSAEVYPELADTDLSQLPAFQSLFRQLRQTDTPTDESQALLSILQRLQQAGGLSDEAAPHFGLGFATYATVTSPIRRYHDLFNHYALKAILQGTQPPLSPSELAEATQEKLGRGRRASRQLEQWLLCQYLADRVGTVHFGTIVGVSPNGISVRLDEIGTNGFVRLSEKGQPRPKFDSRRLTLTTETARYRLDEPVTVKIESVDTEGRNINLSLVSPEVAERLRAFDDQTN